MRWHEIAEDRLDRARRMGFDTSTVWYHATKYDFDEFVPSRWRGAVYFAPTPEGAMRGMSAGGQEHPALSGPTTATAERTYPHIIAAYIRGKTWGRDPLPLEWFPEEMSYGRYRAIIDGAEPIDIPGLTNRGLHFLNRTRRELLPLIYEEAVPESEYELYTGENEPSLPLRRAKLPVAQPFFSYGDVEGLDNPIRQALQAVGFENWLVHDEGGTSIAVSNPANIRVRHASFDPDRLASPKMIESRLSFGDAKEFVADLDTGRGRIAAIAERNPWLRQASQEAARKALGGRFTVYRAVAPVEGLRPDGVASTSLDARVCISILLQAPGVVFRGQDAFMPQHMILRYEITPEQVVMWVPAALEAVRAAVGKRSNHSIEGRYGERLRIAKVLQDYEGHDEQEVIADLRGLTPQVLNATNGHGELYAASWLLQGVPEEKIIASWYDRLPPQEQQRRFARLRKFFQS